MVAITENAGMPVRPDILKEQLAAVASSVGFDSCRVTSCSAPVHSAEFRGWLKDGANGEMEYIRRGEEKRCDPQQVLPGAKSIVVLALNYFQGEHMGMGVPPVSNRLTTASPSAGGQNADATSERMRL